MRLRLVGVLCFLLAACTPAVPQTPTLTPRISPTATLAPTPARPTATSIPGRPTVGQEAHLWARGLSQWHLAVDEQALDAYVSLTSAGDTAGLRQLIQQGRAFPVADETRVLVLEQKWPAVQVRVLEGPQAGKPGWVAFEHVR